MIRTIVVVLLVVAIWAGFMVLMFTHPGERSTELAEYFIENYQEDTGAGNAVAAIYLNYRVYDTLFEALLLLVAIVGIMHFFRGRRQEKQNE
jgi:multisubunit Na+/H+ antiporter MnhB subunit